MSMQLVGFRKSSFDFKDESTGRQVKGDGYTLYIVADPITNYGEGFSTDKVFISTEKLVACGYNPTVGDWIDFNYNKYGKVQSISLVEREVK